MVRVNFLPTNFDDAKQAIIDAFKNDDRSFFKEYFQNYSDGSMLSHVVELFAYMSTYFNYMTSVAANEPFITTAQLDKNIFGSAKSLGFVPHRIVASRCQTRFTLPDNFTARYDPDLTETISLPIYTQFRSRDNKIFTLMESVNFRYDTETDKWRTFKIEDGELILDAASNEDVTDTEYWSYEPITFLIKQGYYEAKIYRPTGEANQQINIERTDIDDESDSIVITSLTSPFTKWEELTNILDFSLMNNNLNRTYDNLSDYAQSYIWMNNTNANGIEITFGDDKFGKIPEEDDILSIKLFVTEGSSGNGKSGFTTSSSIEFKKSNGSTDTFAGTNITSIIDSTNYPNGSSGGADKQTAESVRKIAPYTFASQDRIVNEKDYQAHLSKQNYVSLENVKIVSGEDHSTPFLGGVVCFASKEVQDDNDNIENLFLTINEKETLKYYVKEKCITGNDTIEFIDPEILYVLLSGRVYYNPLIFPKGDVENIFDNTITAYFDSVNSFDSYYKHSNLIGTINNQVEIDHVSLTYHFYLVKKITESIIDDDVTINLGNAIDPESVSSTFSQNLLIPNDEQRYFKVVINPANVEETSPIYRKYYYTLTDNGIQENGNLKLTEIVKDVNDIILSTTVGSIGTINYTTGKITFNFGSYESLNDYQEFGIMSAGYGTQLCFQTFSDVLIDRNYVIDSTGETTNPFFIKFTFDTAVEDAFKAKGGILLNNLEPIVQYIGEQ